MGTGGDGARSNVVRMRQRKCRAVERMDECGRVGTNDDDARSGAVRTQWRECRAVERLGGCGGAREGEQFLIFNFF